MKKLTKRALSLTLAFLLLFSSLNAFATENIDDTDDLPIAPPPESESVFPDIEGHWAEKQLERGYDDGLIQGYDDGKMYPDEYISYVQVLTLLCRMLSPQNQVAYSELGLSGNQWYDEYVAKAASLGIQIKPEWYSKSSISRGEAFALLVHAFQMREVDPELSALGAYPDAQVANSTEQNALAILVDGGYIQGYDGKLNPNSGITRAEYITILYRIAENYMPADELESNFSGGTVASGAAKLTDISFSDPLFLDCTTEDVAFNNVTAETIVVLSQSKGGVSFSGSTLINRLVISGGTGEDITIAPQGSASVDTLVIGDYDGKVTVSGNVSRVEVVGGEQNVRINTALEELAISASNCVVDADGYQKIDKIAIHPHATNNTLSLKGTCGELFMNGMDNTADISGSVDSLTLDGVYNVVKGTGRISSMTVRSSRSTCEIKCDDETDEIDHGIEEAVITVSTQNPLPVGETLNITATLKNATAIACSATLYVDGVEIESKPAVFGPEPAEISFTHSYEYSEEMSLTSKIEVVLSYTTHDLIEQSLIGSTIVTLQNHSAEYYEQYNRENVLATVTTAYKGDWTTEWAENNDYDEKTKNIWINAKGHTSKTEYLVWINLAYQKVNVFKGSGESGDWELDQTFLCGTGALYTPTPVGVYTVWARSSWGWTTGTYNVRPVVNFRVGSGYAFHSRLYNPGHNYLTDPSIGFPVSHGCIRMYDEDVQWIYDNIPNDTTVVVF